MGLCTQVEVSYDDQKRINTFSKLNTRMHDLEAQVKAKKVRQAAQFRARPCKFLRVCADACTGMLGLRRNSWKTWKRRQMS